MSLRFRDEEFQAAWRELDEPQLDGGWELLTEAMGVEIYRRYRPVRTLHKLPVFTPEPPQPTGPINSLRFPLKSP